MVIYTSHNKSTISRLSILRYTFARKQNQPKMPGNNIIVFLPSFRLGSQMNYHAHDVVNYPVLCIGYVCQQHSRDY